MYVHGDNLNQKENHTTKYIDEESKKYLKEIREKYNWWKSENEKLIGPKIEPSSEDSGVIKKRVELFNEYKNFLDKQCYAEKFDSRSNLHSSVLEEFLYYLFKDLVKDFSQYALIGKSHAFKDIFFKANNYKDMVNKPFVKIEQKDHDFVIGTRVSVTFKYQGSKKEEVIEVDVPAIAIECKTYLDKTMLEGSSTSGKQLKDRNPNALYIIVSERLKLTEAVNLKKYAIDQIYVLRKQKNTDRELTYSETYVRNPIYNDVVEHLFNYVREYLKSDWRGSVISEGLNRGYLI
jgi:hypothetical protein